MAHFGHPVPRSRYGDDVSSLAERLVAQHPGGVRDLVQVSDRVWVSQSMTYATNSVVLLIDAGRGECVVVGPAVTPADVVGLAAVIAAKGWQAVAGISTHPHWDHLLWSSKLGAVPRYASPRAIAALTRSVVSQAVVAADACAPGHDLAYLTSLTALAEVCVTATAGVEQVGTQWGRELVAPPEIPGLRVFEHSAHAPGHLVIVYNDVVLVGDMLSDVEPPLLDDGTETGPPVGDPIADYLAGLDLLENLVSRHGVDVAVPGHGSIAQGREAIAARLAKDRAWLAQRQV